MGHLWRPSYLSFLDDHIENRLIPLDNVDNIPFDDDTIVELEYNEYLEFPTNKETSLLASPSPIEIASSYIIAFYDAACWEVKILSLILHYSWVLGFENRKPYLSYLKPYTLNLRPLPKAFSHASL